jgi:hypothetical protein
MMIGSPGARPGGLGTGSGKVSIGVRSISMADCPDMTVGGIGWLFPTQMWRRSSVLAAGLAASPVAMLWITGHPDIPVKGPGCE